MNKTTLAVAAGALIAGAAFWIGRGSQSSDILIDELEEEIELMVSRADSLSRVIDELDSRFSEDTTGVAAKIRENEELKTKVDRLRRDRDRWKDLYHERTPVSELPVSAVDSLWDELLRSVDN